MTQRVLSIVGTRPEAIKMAPVIEALRNCPDVVSSVCVTGQHREMLDQVLSLFRIEPAYDLDVMRANNGLNDIVQAVVAGVDRVIDDFKPDRVLVQGDTSTAMAAALAAFNRGVPIGHIEAGLRTYDLQRPWPEELNRRIIDVASDLLFAPTIGAKSNLETECVTGRILVTGNTVIDALLTCADLLKTDRTLTATIDRDLPTIEKGQRLVLVTGHRRETLGDGLLAICEALSRLATRGDVEIVYPVHLNPNVQGPVRQALAGQPHIHLIPPQSYLSFIRLMQRAHLIVTDSGGVQEEAPALGVPVLVTRTETERPEAAFGGTAELVGADADRIVAAATRLLDDPAVHRAAAGRRNPYGDGRAATRIVRALIGAPVQEFDSLKAIGERTPRAIQQTRAKVRLAARQ